MDAETARKKVYDSLVEEHADLIGECFKTIEDAVSKYQYECILPITGKIVGNGIHNYQHLLSDKQLFVIGYLERLKYKTYFANCYQDKKIIIKATW
jgi:hypothetical protein